MPRAIACLLAAAMLLLRGTALADAPQAPEEPPPEKPPTDVTVSVAPMVWFPRPTGNASFGESSIARPLDFRTQVDLGGQDQVFTGDVVVQIDHRWRLHMDGFHFSIDGQTVFLAEPTQWGSLFLTTGDSIASSLDMTSVEFDAGYALIRAPGGEPGRNFLHISPAVGLRWVDVTESIREIGVGESEGGGSWVGALVGFDVDLAFTPEAGRGWPFHRVEIMGHFAFGPALGSIGGTMIQIRAGLSIWATPYLAVDMGFRLLQVDAADGPYDFDGGLQGVFIGAAVRF